MIEPQSREELEACFRFFDKDHSGLIDENELFLAVNKINSSITRSNVAAMIKTIDLDKSGKISLDGLIFLDF